MKGLQIRRLTSRTLKRWKNNIKIFSSKKWSSFLLDWIRVPLHELGLHLSFEFNKNREYSWESVIHQKCLNIYLLTYLLTPWCRVLLEKLTGLQLVKKFPAFYGTRRFITALTSVRRLSLSCASPIQSTYPHPTFWRSILILSTHLCLGLPSGLFPSGFPTKTLYAPLSSPSLNIYWTNF